MVAKTKKTEEELITRLDEALSKFDIYAPPPEGVKCDCAETLEGVGEHFHLFPVALICDVCGREDEAGDIIAYTKPSSMDKLAVKAEYLGWMATPNCDYTVCPDCKSKGHNLINRG